MSVTPSFAQTSASWCERKALPLSTKRRRGAPRRSTASLSTGKKAAVFSERAKAA